jgi:hypothetical protein
MSRPGCVTRSEWARLGGAMPWFGVEDVGGEPFVEFETLNSNVPQVWSQDVDSED